MRFLDGDRSRQRRAVRLQHPLLGSDPVTMVRLLARNGPLPLRSVPEVALFVAAALARSPLALAESLWVRRLRRRRRPLDPADPARAPIFIVGHWRSGTTHLYNLLSRDPYFACVSPFAAGIPRDFLLFGRALRPLLERALPAERWVDRMEVRADLPQEDEVALASLQTVSFFHGIYFPRHFHRNFEEGIFFNGVSERRRALWERRCRLFLEKVALEQPGRRLLVKNPAHTARVDLLRQLFPGARFLHIHRNPFEVFSSTRNFYRALLRRLALQEPGRLDLDEIVLAGYPRLMERLEADAAGLAPGTLVELRYEELVRAPLEVCARVYRELEIDGFGRARAAIERHLARVAGHERRPFDLAPGEVERVRERWGSWIERWGYRAPAAPSSAASSGEPSDSDGKRKSSDARPTGCPRW